MKHDNPPDNPLPAASPVLPPGVAEQLALIDLLDLEVTRPLLRSLYKVSGGGRNTIPVWLEIMWRCPRAIRESMWLPR